jgi:hypothetical protein
MRTFERELLDLKLRRDLMTFIHRSFQTVAPAQRYLTTGILKRSRGNSSNAPTEPPDGYSSPYLRAH